MRIILEQGTVLELDGEWYEPGDVVEIDEEYGKALIASHSAKEESVV